MAQTQPNTIIKLILFLLIISLDLDNTTNNTKNLRHWNSYLQLLVAHLEMFQQNQCSEAHYALEVFVLESLVYATELCQERFLFISGFTYEVTLFYQCVWQIQLTA